MAVAPEVHECAITESMCKTLSWQMALAGMLLASETYHKTLPGKDALAAGRLINI